MGADSKIEWTHHTFNPWRGCTKISPGCTNCYAEVLSHRNPKTLGIWGDKGTRAMAAESYWREPLKWNKEAAMSGERRRVFCASLADVFEGRPELDDPRQRLFDLIMQTQHLDWLLLTKRPDVAKEWLVDGGLLFKGNAHLWGKGWDNVWLGTSVEDQARADERIPVLLSIPARIHFLSIEPLLGELNIEKYLYLYYGRGNGRGKWPYGKIEWVIVGGESGHGARPMKAEWVRSLRDQCKGLTPFFFKQWGNFNSDGQEVGKKLAGRLLDGHEWNELPNMEKELHGHRS